MSRSGDGGTLLTGGAFRQQKLQQLPIEGIGDLNVRYVAHIWNDHQLGTGNDVGDVFSQPGKILSVPLSAQNQRLELNMRPVIDHRIQIRDLPIDGPYHGEPRPIATERWGIQNADVLLILRFPGIWEVALNVGIRGLPELIMGLRHGCFVGLVRTVPGLAPTYIGEADWIVKYSALRHIRIRSGKPRCQHTSHGVSYDRSLANAERLQQRVRVHGHVVKVVRDDRFRGTAESDLIRHDNTKARLAQGFDGTTEVEASEIHSVEQNHGPPVRLARGWNVHIRHAHVLPVQCQRQIHHWIWIGDIFIGDTARLYISRSLHHG